ncbi:hypothetical protein JC525_08875 [Alteromonas sp. IB21]|uniref:hypothetical protein n=1 Tax=Alteromonas sp. IB21 TaxID=2779369 RepID=UPI0018E7BB2F|nr:hypothetical protein [Alteromonas sp. IB21]MBJ2129048.1 hypothetical protein [Alteromonas sp. IB21]
MAVYTIQDPNSGRTVSLEGDSPPNEQELEQIFSQLGSSSQPEQRNLPQETMSTFERGAAGLGRFMTEVGQGAKQIGMEAGEAVGIVDEGSADAYQQKIAEEKALWDKYSEGDTAARTGEVAGAVGAAFLPMGAATKGAGLLKSTMQAGGVGAIEAGLQPVYEGDNFIKEKGEQAAVGAAFGAGANAGLDALGRVVENVLPSNVITRGVNIAANKADDEFVKQGRDIIERTGIELTPGAQTGSKSLTFLENRARQSFFSAEKAFKADEKIGRQAVEHIEDLATRMKGEAIDAEGMGNALRNSIKKSVDDILDSRDKMAQKNYGMIREALPNGNFNTSNVVEEAKRILDEYEGVSGSEALKVRREMKRVVKDLQGKKVKTKDFDPIMNTPAEFKSNNIDLSTALKNRSYFSRVSKGAANLFKDIQSAEQRRIGARLTQAIERDFDDLAETAGSDVGALLKEANQSYRQHMQSIDYIEKTAIGKMLGEDTVAPLFGASGNSIAPEKVAQKFLSLKPSEMKSIVGVLEKHSPETVKAAKSFMLTNALSAAKNFAPSHGAKTLHLSGPTFIKELRGTNGRNAEEGMKRIASLFDKTEVEEIKLTIEALERWGDKFGYNFSGTAAANEFVKASSGGIVGGLNTLVHGLGARKVAEAMANPTVRKNAIALNRLPPQSARARQYLSMLAPFFADEAMEDEKQDQNSI